MWVTVLAFALWVATDPTRPFIVLVLMSRRRPRHNLLAYWLGGVAASIAPGLILLLVLRDSLPMVMEDVRSTVARFTGGYFQIAIGALALLIAALVSAGVLARQHVGAPTYGGAQAAPVLRTITPTALSRLRARVSHALQGGNPWVAFVIGLLSTVPPVD